MKKSLSKDQRGLGQVLVVVIVLVVIAAVGFGAWRVLKKNKTNSPPATAATTAAESSCNSTYHDANLCKFAATAVNFTKTYYTATGTTTSNGTTSTFTMQSDGKGDFAINSSASGQSSSIIEIGTTSYIKSGSTWMKYSSGASAVSNPSSNVKFDFSQNSTPAAKKIQYKALGTESVGGVNCYKYQIIDPSTPNATQYFWISTSDYSVQQFYIKNAGSTTQMTFSYKAVTIKAPSPVMDMSASTGASGSSSSSSSSSGLTAAEQAQLQAAEKQAQSANY